MRRIPRLAYIALILAWREEKTYLVHGSRHGGRLSVARRANRRILSAVAQKEVIPVVRSVFSAEFALSLSR